MTKGLIFVKIQKGRKILQAEVYGTFTEDQTLINRCIRFNKSSFSERFLFSIIEKRWVKKLHS